MTDLMQRLQDARPTDVELQALWPVAQRDDVLDRVLDSTSRRTDRGTRHRHVRAAVLAAAASVAALAILPHTIGSGSAAAEADLRALAAVALDGDGPLFAPGTFLHVRTEAIQQNNPDSTTGDTYETNREAWVRWDGTTWAIDTSLSGGWRDYNVFPRSAEPSFAVPTPEFAASLPDTPDALRGYLDENVSGSSSHEEAVFVAITDLANSYFLPPRTLAAALEVLADVDGVKTEDVTVGSRSAVRITYTETWGMKSAQQSVTLDRATAQVLSQNDSSRASTYDRTTTFVEVVDAIPAAVKDAYSNVEPGTRIYDDQSATPH